MRSRAADARPKLSVDVICQAAVWDEIVDRSLLERAAAAAYATAGFSGETEVSLLLTGDAAIRSLNATWRGKDEPTNVLSFPLEATPADGSVAHLGDIALAIETVTREAAEKHISASHHAAHLVVHGLLHLLGYDHLSESEAERMELLETRILEGLGLPGPYAAELMEGGELR